MSNVRKLMSLVLMVFALTAVGTASGALVQNAYPPQPVLAGCEDDECEGGSQCKDNPGGNTSCSYEGSGCRTKGCSGGGGGSQIE